MKQRSALHIVFVSAFLAAAPAAAAPVMPNMSVEAQTTAESVIAMLERAGYSVMKIEKTLLRRIRILAENEYHVREVVVSGSTGEIKSNMVISFARNANQPGEIDNEIRQTEATSSTTDDDKKVLKQSGAKDADDDLDAGKGIDDDKDKKKDKGDNYDKDDKDDKDDDKDDD